MKKVELLAPAGDYEAFLGAVAAGADAVYLGGGRFGARAYAHNFTEEEVCRAIRYAHLFGRKVYLTVNTLIKEQEFPELYGYLCPYYEAGLDGVIVQDLGAASYIRRQFPEMELHISTQATVTGVYGARWMKQLGAVRIVPARELSLEEIRHMKEETGLEVETFIHGAVCYCYSGQCLFSSTLGGRSGNRGRCAQPCRLPYNGGHYPLSLKDMCTIEHIPELIEAGIDSFKIEGRMKKPEYAAGVTAVYRKYIDRYYKDPAGEFHVEAADLERLKQLYIRSELQDGYYFRHNGKEMVTHTQPGYAGCPEEVLQEIRARYLERKMTVPVNFEAEMIPGKPMKLTAATVGRKQSVTVYGMEVQEAANRPLTPEDIEKQLRKTGDTCFSHAGTKTEIEGSVFLPVKALNELRRSALEELERKLLTQSVRETPPPVGRQCAEKTELPEGQTATVPQEKQTSVTENGLCVEVHDLEQAAAVLKVPGIKRLYLPSECFSDHGIGGIYGFLAQTEVYRLENPGFQIYLALPHIFRERSAAQMEAAWRDLQLSQVDGVLVRNLEELEWLWERGCKKPVTTDASLYVWNRETAALLAGWAGRNGMAFRMTLPLELSRRELAELSGEEHPPAELVVYGRTPLMVTANCIRKTMEHCTAGKAAKSADSFLTLTDRYRKKFPVWTNCVHCYNVIYNSVPTSLHTFEDRFGKWKDVALRLVFTTEKEEETKAVLSFYGNLISGRKAGEPPFSDYTSGYFKRGVE